MPGDNTGGISSSGEGKYQISGFSDKLKWGEYLLIAYDGKECENEHVCV